MLRGVMGDEHFFAALRDYGSEESFGYGNATTADFQRVCEDHYGGSLQWFFDEWVYGEGEPVYAYYWASAGAGTSAGVDLSIRQVQPDRVFVMPIDVRFSFASGDTTVAVWNDRAVTQHRFAFGREVVDVVVDPDRWILASVEERNLDSIALSINPNPFNSSARVGFEMGNAGSVAIDVYDVAGAYVQTLLNGSRGAGYHEVTWDGKNSAGESVSSGVYFVRIQSAAGALVRKAVVVE
jgi:hypothetical protein